MTFGRPFAISKQLGVDFIHFDLIDLLIVQELAIADFVDFDLLQHLTDDDFDMLVVNRHALQAIDFLDFVDEVGCKLFDTLNGQNVMRRWVAVDNVIALFHDVARLKIDVLALWNEVFDRVRSVVWYERNAALVLVIATELDRARGFRDDRGFLWTTGFKQLGNTRQTAGDVARFGALERDTGQNIARLDLVARINRDNRFHWKQIPGFATPRELQDLALSVHDQDSRLQIGRTHIGAVIDNNALRDTGRLVGRFNNRGVFHEIFVLDDTVHFRDDWTGIGIPIRNTLTALDRIALSHAQA